MTRLSAAMLAALLVAAPAFAAPKGERVPIEMETVPARTVSLIVYGNDPCPRSNDNEIVVCARQPENERYRVPKQFRGKKKDPGGQSWASRVATLEYVSRAGTPNSCSVVGSGGQTGCYQQFLRQAREERRQDKVDAANIP